MDTDSKPYRVLEWIELGVNLTAISKVSGWPPRQIQLLASRHGYLFGAVGAPYKPPAGQRPTPASKT